MVFHSFGIQGSEPIAVPEDSSATLTSLTAPLANKDLCDERTLTPMASPVTGPGDRRRLSDGRTKLPWLTEKMPGDFDSSLEMTPVSPPTSSDASGRRPCPKGRDHTLLKRDPSLRAIGSVPHLHVSARPSVIHRASSHEAPHSHAHFHDEDGNISPTTQPRRSRRPSLAEQLGMNGAVTDLERLMKEAVQVALQAAQQGRKKELTDVLRDATDHIHRARTAHLVVDSDSEEVSPVKPYDDLPEDSAIETKTLPVRITVQKPPDTMALPVAVRAEIHNPSRISTPLHFYDRQDIRSPLVLNRTAHAPRDNIVETMDWAASRRRKSSVPAIEHTPWAPKHAPTNLVDYDLPSPSRRCRGSRRLDINEDDFIKSRREKRHYRNLDPDTKGLSLKRKPHFSLRKDQGFNFGHHTKRQPIARKWSTLRKRFTATVACINTAFTGYVIGVYAGEVPRIQYQIVDPNHYIILGNVMLFLGLAFTTFFLWPLPLLHGRKPYTLGAFALVLPLQFPQAVVVSSVRAPNDESFRVGLLLSRLFTGLALGLANINFITTLLDLFGASLQSSNPHQELVIIDDVRRQGGGMGLWLGIWSWCFVGSIALGFLTGAGIIAHLNPEWGFYITCIIGVVVLLLNVMTPETRRSPFRRSFTEFVDEEEKVRRRIARGEVKLHLDTEGPMWWGEEVWAGIMLNFKMLFQWGFFILASYLGWVYALVVLVIVLLGSLLSRDYQWRSQYVGLGVFAIGIGALMAVPLSKAGLLSRDRKKGFRTDSMTFEKQFTRSSHMVRRIIFMIVLPLAGIAYTLSSPGGTVHWILPIFFAGFIGFLTNLGIAECVGLIMETFDTSDLQPGVNSRHRLKSMASNVKRRRTNYSSFPRVTSGIFVSQTIGFLLAAAATGVGSVMTRTLGSQTATAITAAVLLFITILLTTVLYRFKSVQVIPNHAFGTKMGTFEWNESTEKDEYWKPVVIGNPSGKMRSMSVLELGNMSRWTEIRLLNKLIKPRGRNGEERDWA